VKVLVICADKSVQVGLFNNVLVYELQVPYSLAR
jgi:hypothetical protein